MSNTRNGSDEADLNTPQKAAAEIRLLMRYIGYATFGSWMYELIQVL